MTLAALLIASAALDVPPAGAKERSLVVCAPTERPVKACACGLQYSLEAWERLELLAARWDAGNDGIDVLQLRNCRCGSSIAVPVEELIVRAREEVRDAPRTDEELARAEGNDDE